MLFVRSWLEKYINLAGISNTDIAEAITMKSSEVEDIFEISDWFDGKVLVGKIQNVHLHPNADRLRVFDVNLGNRSVQIVSAAPNVAEGLIVPVALEGAQLPGLTIAPRPMRGEKSQGMCCGKSELMLEDGFSDGLWQLNQYDEIDSKLGMSICEALPEMFPEQTVFDIKVLPDKIGSIGNHLGMGLEISQCLHRPDLLTGLGVDVTHSSTDWKQRILNRISKKSNHTIAIHDESGYSDVFCLFELDTKKEYFLPKESVQHMFFAQKNIIGGLADVSNYVLNDVGQPNHFFSVDKLHALAHQTKNTEAQTPTEAEPLDLTWKISRSNGGGIFHGLGQLKKVEVPAGVDTLTQNDTDMLAIPAISGGASSKMDTAETQAIVEFAHFPAERVARNSFALNYRSEGAKIWAGQVNPRQIILGLLSLLDNLADDVEMRVIGCLFESKTELHWQTALDQILDKHSADTIAIDYDYIARRLDGQDKTVWKQQIDEVLNMSGNVINGMYHKNPFFSMLNSQEDLLHEVGKHIGYDNLQDEFLQVSTATQRSMRFNDTISIRTITAKFGFTEIISRPFISAENVKNVYGDTYDEQLLTLLNPYNSTEPHVRPGLLPHLINAVAENVQAGFKTPQLCELNKVYFQEKGAVAERIVLETVALMNDPYATTSMVLDILRGLYPDAGIEASALTQTSIGNSVEYRVNNTTVAWVSEVKNAIKKAAGIPLGKRIWAAEIDITQPTAKSHFFAKYQDETDFPPLKRSYSLTVPQTIRWSDLEPIFTSVSIAGSVVNLTPTERFGHDHKDVFNLNVKWTSPDRTLTHDEVDAWFTQIQTALEKIGVHVRN